MMALGTIYLIIYKVSLVEQFCACLEEYLVACVKPVASVHPEPGSNSTL